MSKRFLRQDHTVYKRLKKVWRRPKGRQSKFRRGKSGSGLRAKIGYGTQNRKVVNVVWSAKDLEGKKEVLIGGSVGSKKANEIFTKANEKGIKILNMKKIKKARKIEKSLKEKATLKQEKGKEVKAIELAKEVKDIKNEEAVK